MTLKTIATVLLGLLCTPAFAQSFGCFNLTQSPDTTLTPVNIGTVVTLSVDTIDAVRAEIDGVPLTPTLDPNTNSANSWTATTTVIVDRTIDVVVYSAGDTSSATCSWTIDILDSPAPPAPPTQTKAAAVPLMNPWLLAVLVMTCAGIGASRIRGS